MKGPLDNPPFIPSGGGGVDNWPLVQNTGEGSSKNSFVFTIETTGVSETFTLPLEAGGTYNFIIGHGDGEFSLITAFNDAAVTHTYVNAGIHQIVIEGEINGWRFNNTGDRTKMRDIKSWGCLQLGNSNGYFHGCTGLTVSATDILNLAGTTTLINAFRSCIALSTVPSMNSWDMSNITNLYLAFMSCLKFNQDITGWDVSNVSNMGYMFSGAVTFNQDIGGWDTSSVTTAQYMFRYANAFDQDLGSWDITSLTDGLDMFLGTTLTTANYDSLLIGWAAQAEQLNVIFSGGNSKYTGGGAAEAARASLIANGWIITDGGIA